MPTHSHASLSPLQNTPPEACDAILIAPNVSEQMGGEAIKALQIYRELERQGLRVHQITHIRARPELERNFPSMRVTYVADTLLEKILFRLRFFELALNYIFLRHAIREARRLLAANPRAIVHFTSPISPILPYPKFNGATVVIGPLNGNVHYPPCFRAREPRIYKIRRLLHHPLQFLHRIGPSGKRRAAALLVAGGQRTFESLRWAGCRDEQFVSTVDSGVLTSLRDVPRITHSGQNLRFVHCGRLVNLKGTDLILRALPLTRLPIELDIVGRGPELDALRSLVAELGLNARVRFLDWLPHAELVASFRQYRGFVFPTLCEANGIVVQEAMAQGLPVIACDWGGPALLVTPGTGILVPVETEEQVISELAAAMDRLAADGVLAESMSLAARDHAFNNSFFWDDVIRDWRALYARLQSTPGHEK